MIAAAVLVLAAQLGDSAPRDPIVTWATCVFAATDRYVNLTEVDPATIATASLSKCVKEELAVREMARAKFPIAEVDANLLPDLKRSLHSTAMSRVLDRRLLRLERLKRP